MEPHSPHCDATLWSTTQAAVLPHHTGKPARCVTDTKATWETLTKAPLPLLRAFAVPGSCLRRGGGSHKPLCGTGRRPRRPWLSESHLRESAESPSH